MSARDLPPGLSACRAVIGGEADPFAAVWRDIPETEQAFWLTVSRCSKWHAGKPWRDIPGDIRCKIKANLYRAAKRAADLLECAA